MAASSVGKTRKDNTKPKSGNKPSLAKRGKGKEKENLPPAGLHETATPARLDPPLDKDWEPWNWASLSDPSSSKVSPVFSKDGSYFFTLVGSNIKIHSSATGSVVSTLTAPPPQDSHSEALTCALINAHNPFQLITGSLDGRILIWDYVGATLLKSINVGQAIHYMCAHEKLKDSVVVVVSRNGAKGPDSDAANNAVVLQVSLNPTSPTSSDITSVGKTRSPAGIAISANGSWLVVAGGHKVYIAKTESLSSGFTKYVSPDRLTCLAFHPTDEYFATGDSKGVIRIWYCLNDTLAIGVKGVEKRTHTRSLHWHAHAVSSLAFTRNGAYLLSGGEEAVLVVWQLVTGKKEFVPRVGAPINTIAVSPSTVTDEEYLVGLADATLLFVSSARLKVSRSFSRLKTDPASTSDWPSLSPQTSIPLAVHALSSSIILPSSHPSSLQFYSPFNSTLLAELEVSPSNRVSRRDDKPIVPSRVERVSVAPSGEWMASVDIRDADVGFHPEVYLKLWKWDTLQKTWILHTRVNRPHGTGDVSHLEFSPCTSALGSLFLLTAGADSRTKIWKLNSGKNGNDTWVSHATVAFRSEVPSSASWSSDSSLFAVSTGSQVALYDTATGTLCQSVHPAENREIKSVAFVGSNDRYVLVSGARYLLVWDLLTNSVVWQTTTPQTIEKVVPNPTDMSFLVFYLQEQQDGTTHTNISIFQALSSKPIAQRSLPYQLQNCVYNPLKTSGSCFVGLTTTWKLVEFGDGQLSSSSEVTEAKDISTQDASPHRRTLFRDIFGSSAFDDWETTQVARSTADSLPRSGKEFDVAFSQPVYVTRPFADLFDGLMDSMLRPSVEADGEGEEGREDNGRVQVDDDEDVVMDEATSEPVLTTSSQSIRAPLPNEMDLFTQLFKTYCRTGAKPTTSTNGTAAAAKVNGRQVNGVRRSHKEHVSTPSSIPASTPLKTKTIVQETLNDTPTSASNTPMSGKKRKKAPS